MLRCVSPAAGAGFESLRGPRKRATDAPETIRCMTECCEVTHVPSTPIGKIPRSPRRSRLAMTGLLLACPLGLLAPGCASPGAPGLEVFPEHFQLHPGERIHYT